MGLNRSMRAVKSSMVFIFSKYLRNGFKYLTVSFASKQAVLTSFSSLQSVKEVVKLQQTPWHSRQQARYLEYMTHLIVRQTCMIANVQFRCA